MNLAELAEQTRNATLVFGFLFLIFALFAAYVVVLENFFGWFVLSLILLVAWAWVY